MSKRVIQYLNTKKWYKYVKVFYIIIFLVFYLLIMKGVVALLHDVYTTCTNCFDAYYSTDEKIKYTLINMIYIIGIPLAFEIIRRIFYFIVYLIKIKNQKT